MVLLRSHDRLRRNTRPRGSTYTALRCPQVNSNRRHSSFQCPLSRMLDAAHNHHRASGQHRRRGKRKPLGKEELPQPHSGAFLSERPFALQICPHTLFHTRFGLYMRKPAQGRINLLIKFGFHWPLLSLARSNASSFRALKIRERMEDSVVEQIAAISAVDSSSTAESNSASRSFFGSRSISSRIRAHSWEEMTDSSARRSAVVSVRACVSMSSVS